LTNDIVKKIVYSSIGVALVTVATLFLKFPIPSGAGYINLGDSLIIIIAFLFGPIVGGLAGGLGSCFADMLGGFMLYSPFSLVIKGIEGVVLGILCNRNKKLYLHQLWAYVVGGAIMVFGYFWADYILFDIRVALIGILYNLIQMTVNIVVVSLAYRQIFKIYVMRSLFGESLSQVKQYQHNQCNQDIVNVNESDEIDQNLVKQDISDATSNINIDNQQ